MAPDSSPNMAVADQLVEQRVLALVQHQRVMDEAAQVLLLAAQARRLAAATPVFASQPHLSDMHQRINWVPAS